MSFLITSGFGNANMPNQNDNNNYGLVLASLMTIDGTPDLHCTGEIHWIDVQLGSTVTGSFTS